MYPKENELPTPLDPENIQSLDDLDIGGGASQRPVNVFIGHNLGHRVFTLSLPFMEFYEMSDVANNPENGPVAQRKLDVNHSKKLAIYMLKGLVSAAALRRKAKNQEVPDTFEEILHQLGNQPYFSLQPLVCTIRNINPGGTGDIGGQRMVTNMGETAAFKIFLSQQHVLWVIDGQHRRDAANQVVQFLKAVRSTRKYPAKTPVLFPRKGDDVTDKEALVWDEVYFAARQWATVSVEVHLGLSPDEERQLFHDLNQLGKRVDRSLALDFDSSNPITHFIKEELLSTGLVQVQDKEPKLWRDCNGRLALKDVVAVSAIAFLNKGNVSGATPAVIDPRTETVMQMWESISTIPDFGEEKAKEKTVAAQPVMLKAIAKLVFDLKFSKRRPSNGDEQLDKLLQGLVDIDFSHNNPVWQYYSLSEEEKSKPIFDGLAKYLPSAVEGVNRDLGAHQDGFMRFGAKHNDIFPILADMIRWQLKLDNRHS